MQKVANCQRKVGYFKRQFRNFKKNKAIVMFLIPAMLLTLMFGYVPMTGIIFAFKEKVTPTNWLYDTLTSPFTFNHILNVFSDPEVLTALINTLIISFSKIIIFFPLTIILAILLCSSIPQSTA